MAGLRPHERKAFVDWHQRAVIYEAPPELFLDSNGDGVGDFDGLAHALDYLANLGVTVVWLLPFYDSPRKDDGYDVRDYYRVDPRFGSAGDFVRFLKAAEARGMRVIVDITFSHTSDEHPWFQAARADPKSIYRDFYIWAEEPIHLEGDENLVGVGKVWTYDRKAKAYYHHNFYPFQPDLNASNPRLREEMKKILGYWLRLGVSGFRMDAVPRMLQPKGDVHYDGDPKDLLRELRDYVVGQRHDAILLGEVDTDPNGYEPYFGNGDRLHMVLNFYLPGNFFLALVDADATRIRHVFEALPPPPTGANYANFLRNHDELDFERLTSVQQERVLDALAPEKEMRIYGRGSRRRLAPLLKSDGPLLRLAHSLLLSLPGVPVMYYGDEIGMGDDLTLKERNSVRTPMQWSSRKNGGFSDAEVEALVHPVITGGEYGYETLNVAAQRKDPTSLLNFVQRAIRARRDSPEYGGGEPKFIDVDHRSVLAHMADLGGAVAMAFHNLSDERVTVTLPDEVPDLSDAIELFSDGAYEDVGDGRTLELAPHGFRWFRTGEFPA
ncbi:MAG TPA: alpha-amylase family protein [Trueperaceae bacterium]